MASASELQRLPSQAQLQPSCANSEPNLHPQEKHESARRSSFRSTLALGIRSESPDATFVREFHMLDSPSERIYFSQHVERLLLGGTSGSVQRFPAPWKTRSAPSAWRTPTSFPASAEWARPPPRASWPKH